MRGAAFRRLLKILLGKVYHHGRFLVINPFNMFSEKSDLLPGIPMARFDDEFSDHPMGVVDQDSTHGADHPIDGADCIPGHFTRALQMTIFTMMM